MVPELRPCGGCHRHVRAGARRCPFCDAEVGAPRAMVGAALAVGSALALGGCQRVLLATAHAEERALEPASLSAQYAAPPRFFNTPDGARAAQGGADAGTATDAASAPSPPSDAAPRPPRRRRGS